MNSKETVEEIELILRSKRTILYLVSQEENRVISALESMCSKADTNWDLIKMGHSFWITFFFSRIHASKRN